MSGKVDGVGEAVERAVGLFGSEYLLRDEVVDRAPLRLKFSDALEVALAAQLPVQVGCGGFVINRNHR